MAIKTILVSQPKPENNRSPYFDLAEKHDLKIDFRPFIKVEGVNASEFRNQRINLADYSAVLLTSKVAADHFFRIAEETRYEVPDSLKYFCISEAVALYLQKYIAYRKRKIFFKFNSKHSAFIGDGSKQITLENFLQRSFVQNPTQAPISIAVL